MLVWPKASDVDNETFEFNTYVNLDLDLPIISKFIYGTSTQRIYSLGR